MITFRVIASDSDYPFNDDYYESDGLTKEGEQSTEREEGMGSGRSGGAGLDGGGLSGPGEEKSATGLTEGAQQDQDLDTDLEISAIDEDKSLSDDALEADDPIKEMREAREAYDEALIELKGLEGLDSEDEKDKTTGHESGDLGEPKESPQGADKGNERSAEEVIETYKAALENYKETHQSLYGVAPPELTHSGPDYDRPWSNHQRDLEAGREIEDRSGTHKTVQGNVQREWMGRGAELLGLSGAPEIQQRQELLSGKLPDGTQLGTVKDGEVIHRRGHDMVFSAPKSVSLIAALGSETDKTKVKEAIFSATRDTVSLMEERHAGVRIHTKEGMRFEQTGNLTAAAFLHMISRDLDPHAHVHVNVFNMSQLDSGQWRSVTMDHILANTKAYGLYFKAQLAEKLEQAGFSIDRNFSDGRFEIKGTDQELIRHFSKGLQRVIADTGETRTSRSTNLANDRTRPKKNKITVQARDNIWQAALAASGKNLPESSLERSGQTPKVSFDRALDKSPYFQALKDERKNGVSTLTARVVAESLERHDAKNPVHSKLSVETMALTRGEGQVTFKEITQAMEALKEKGLIFSTTQSGRDQITTARVLGMERGLATGLEAGKNAVKPFVSTDIVNTRISKAEGQLASAGQPLILNLEQRAFVEKALTTKDRSIILIGEAGTGKTTALKVLDAALGKDKLWIASPSNKLKEGALSDGLKAVTHAWLDMRTSGVTMQGQAPSPRLKRMFKGKIIAIDEASLAGTDQLARFAQFANSVDARLILIGDKQQIESPSHGGGFGLAQQIVSTSSLKTVQRVTLDVDRKLFAAARIGDSKEIISQLGPKRLKETPHTVDLVRALYAEAIDRLGDRGLFKIAVPVTTNEARRSVNELLRDVRSERGDLGPTIFDRKMAFDRGINQHDRANASTYKPGDLIMVTGANGIKLDGKQYNQYDRLTVQSIDTAKQTLTLSDGKKDFIAKPSSATFTGNTNLFAERHRDIKLGDMVTFEITDTKKGVMRGATALLTDVTPEKVSFLKADGSLLTLARNDPVLAHLDHGYATTSHRLQGTSFDTVLLTLTEHLKTTTAQSKQLYVMISRVLGRETSSPAKINVIGEAPDKQIERATARRHEAATGIGSLGASRSQATMQSKAVRGLTIDRSGRSTLRRLVDSLSGRNPVDKTGLDSLSLAKSLGRPSQTANNSPQTIISAISGPASPSKAPSPQQLASQPGQMFGESASLHPASAEIANEKSKTEGKDRSFAEKGIEMDSPAFGKDREIQQERDLPSL